MRINQIHHVDIDHRTLSVNCDHCRVRHLLEHERLSVHGFVVHATRLAKQHRHCGQPSRAMRSETIARELRGLMESEAEEMQLALAGRGHVVPFARGVTTTSDAPGLERYSQPSAAHPAGRLARLAEPVLCIHCRETMTKSSHSICTPCQQRYGVASCMNRIRKSDIATEIKAHAAGAGEVN